MPAINAASAHATEKPANKTTIAPNSDAMAENTTTATSQASVFDLYTFTALFPLGLTPERHPKAPFEAHRTLAQHELWQQGCRLKSMTLSDKPPSAVIQSQEDDFGRSTVRSAQ